MNDRNSGGRFTSMIRAGKTGSGDDPIAAVEAEHASLLAVCDLLEQIADGLPNQIKRVQARFVASSLSHALPEHMRFEEDDLFPLLRKRALPECPIPNILEQLEQEHEADEAFAEEIAEELRVAARRGQPRNAEMLGYMLRGFFISQRRHIQWENALLLPIAREVLEPDDLSHLNRRLEARARRRFGASRPRAQRAFSGARRPGGAKVIPLRRQRRP